MIEWEQIGKDVQRLRVYRGWFVRNTVGIAVGIFVPDPNKEWVLEAEKVVVPAVKKCGVCGNYHSGGC